MPTGNVWVALETGCVKSGEEPFHVLPELSAFARPFRSAVLANTTSNAKNTDKICLFIRLPSRENFEGPKDPLEVEPR